MTQTMQVTQGLVHYVFRGLDDKGIHFLLCSIGWADLSTVRVPAPTDTCDAVECLRCLHFHRQFGDSDWLRFARHRG